MTQIAPYIFFEGRCDEAAAFYAEALGAKVTARFTYGDSPDKASIEPGTEGKVMHMNIQIGDTQIMASDGRNSGKPDFRGLSLTITTPSEDEAKRIFAALSEKGDVQMPMTPTFFSPAFGMVADKFGLSWMVIVEKAV